VAIRLAPLFEPGLTVRIRKDKPLPLEELTTMKFETIDDRSKGEIRKYLSAQGCGKATLSHGMRARRNSTSGSTSSTPTWR
jgi:hypothetical protein